ncbi:glycosyltransferase [Sphingomonas bacterium]|uniref:glycosyltransferase n=1 Tax=Sphingomonas bacterium TaxID=1895847 RepID=UPI0015752E87|nr:glycosyltransferase [Sphingomonas bacterium]
MSEGFTFGIPLIARVAAGDWALVERLLALTLRSVLAQRDGDFQVILAAHDLPEPWRAVERDPRFTLLRADWSPAPPTAANDDGGAKKWLVKQRVRDAGGGLLMFLDADDWVSRDLVASARACISDGHVGAIVDDGIALDWRTLRAARFPMADVFEGGFPDLCGSSTIGRVVLGRDDPLLLDPHAALGSHHEWRNRAAAIGAPLARLPVEGVYMVGTGQNHSERQGPFADWRRDVTEAVRRTGKPLDTATAQGFGQDLAALRERA